MKKIILALLVAVGMFAIPQQAKSQYASVSFQLFYDELSPYGMWVDNPSYGYVWVPNVGAGFRPYGTEGYWIYTDAGWTWVSDYSWGWAPFHYGRWDYDPYYGYMWIPGNEWGPAWVSWRHCDGYYGWTALGPGIGLGVGYASYNPAPERWIFVHEHDFGNRNINNYYVNQTNNVTIINKSTVINNTVVNNSRHETYIAGPDRAQVQKVTGKPLNPVAINEGAKPGVKVNNDRLQVYRPKVENAAADHKPAPSKVFTPAEAKPVLEKRGLGNQNAAPVNKRLDTREPTPVGKPNNPAAKPNAPEPATQKRELNPQQGNGKRIMPSNGAPINEPRKIEPQQRPQNPQRVNPTAPVNNDRRVQPGGTNPAQKRELTPNNEPRMRSNQPENNRVPVQPRQVSPPQRQQQPPVQRVNPNPPQQQQPMQRVNPNPPQQQQPMQRVNPNPPQQQPMQRANPNPAPVRPQNMNPPGNQRMPMQGGNRPH